MQLPLSIIHKLGLTVICLMASLSALADSADPHYVSAGFFDVHVCNWPDRPPFLMALFSTAEFDAIERVSVFSTEGAHVGDLNLEKFMALTTKAGVAKRVFITHFAKPMPVRDGWFRAVVTLKDGRQVEARDYVVDYSMGFADGLQPAPGVEQIAIPSELSWNPLPGAKAYKVYLRDKWEDRVIWESGLVRENRVSLPAGLLVPGGEYAWRIHARDSDGNALLGDFNHGSLGPEASFTVK